MRGDDQVDLEGKSTRSDESVCLVFPRRWQFNSRNVSLNWHSPSNFSLFSLFFAGYGPERRFSKSRQLSGVCANGQR